MANQNTLAFTIQGGGVANITPWIGIGYPVTGTTLTPKTTKAALPDEYYWVCILNASEPGIILIDFVIPGASNPTIPANLDAAMSNPDAIFVVTTKQLSLQNVPKGDWYNFLVKYGAKSELQRLNQLSTTLQPGVFNYAGGSNLPPPTYELATITQPATIVAMSLMPSANGKPPYSLIDTYTVNTRIKSTRTTARTKVSSAKPTKRK